MELTGKGNVTEAECLEVVKALGVPSNMIQFRFQPWVKKLLIRTVQKLSEASLPVGKTIGELKLICFPLIIDEKETAILL